METEFNLASSDSEPEAGVKGAEYTTAANTSAQGKKGKPPSGSQNKKRKATGGPKVSAHKGAAASISMSPRGGAKVGQPLLSAEVKELLPGHLHHYLEIGAENLSAEEVAAYRETDTLELFRQTERKLVSVRTFAHSLVCVLMAFLFYSLLSLYTAGH